ncbi:MAG: heterodisulfide reductase, subunit B [Candidatus Stahlbacteria bacterium]|nr:MAG: heterodisulfide reductase, subunit B [Candidatus Stahlbacteria bacterium]
MKSFAYYPGCTMKTTGKAFEQSAFAIAKVLDIQMREIERWNCCGTVFSLTIDDTMHHMATIRNLVRVEAMGESEVLTLCSMCYNTLKRANEFISSDPVRLSELNDFMYKEDLKYSGHVQVRHLLEVLRDDVGWDALKAKVTNPLEGVKVASYYGCALVRPEGAGVDSLEDPTVMEDLVSSLGAEPVQWQSRLECCGSYHTIGHKELVFERTERIVSEALKAGADVIILSCPLCEFNVGSRQPEVAEHVYGFKQIPVLYFTQLMGLALGIDPKELGMDDEAILKLIREKVEV